MTLVNFCMIICVVSLIIAFIGIVLLNPQLTQLAIPCAALSGGVLVFTHMFSWIDEDCK